MNPPQRPLNKHDRYHAHVYFDETTSGLARSLCKEIGDRFDLLVGRFHDKPVGPHPLGSCQVAFNSEDFNKFLSWLDTNRGELTIFVHGLTGDDFADHTDHAYWLGEEMSLNLDVFKNV